MRAVITGGSGLVGSHLAEMLLARKYDVISLSRGSMDTSFLSGIGARAVKADITDKQSVKKNIEKGDAVFHTAAALGAARGSSRVYDEANVKGTVNVLEASIEKDAGIFVFVSSFSAMGPAGSVEKPMSEETPCRPHNLYGKSKLEAEQRIREIAKDRIPCLIVRPPVIYGPRMNMYSGASRIFTNMMKKTFVIIGNTQNYFPFCYVKNLVSAMIYFAEKKEEGILTYLIADSDPVKFSDMLMLIRNAAGVNKRIIRMPRWIAYSLASVLGLTGRIFGFNPALSRDVVREITGNGMYYDISKARESGYEPPYTIEEGVAETVDWLKKIKRAKTD